MEKLQESAMRDDKKCSMIIIDKSLPILRKQKKRDGLMNLFRVIMHMFRFGSGKSKSTQVQAASALRSVVGSMRPLHLQSDHPSSPRPGSLPVPEPEPFEAYTPFMAPSTQLGGSSCASPSASSSSRYASANDLLQLVRKESEFEDDDEESEEEEEETYYDDKSADDMIDSKADAFIASFYAQMRDQHETHNGRNRR